MIALQGNVTALELDLQETHRSKTLVGGQVAALKGNVTALVLELQEATKNKALVEEQMAKNITDLELHLSHIS